jgi:signal transduction histidine kinase
MRSISTKLILAFLSIGVVSIVVITITARWNTRTEFIRFLSDQTQTDLVTGLSDYHRANGSWEGVENASDLQSHNTSPVDGHAPPPPPSFILTDEKGVVIIPGGGYNAGDALSAVDMESGMPLMEDGTLIGFFIPLRKPYEGAPRELEFIERINTTLFYGALIGAVLALALGIFLSRTLTRPIRELTKATHAISEGDLSQQVTVHSNDELGELAQAFNKMSAELSRSVNARRQMTADIAHELRTPLSLILGHAEAVHDGVLPPTKENFEIIREETARLEHLVNDLRTLSLADAGELTISLQPIEPERLIQEVASLYQFETQKKNISLELDAASPLPTIEVDPGRITQVLTNILDNALRHTPAGGKIVLSAKQAGDHVELAIQDNGPGLPAEELDRIFERFYRTDSSRQRDGDLPGSSGLGLAIAKSIVQAHGGQVAAESDSLPSGEARKGGLKVIVRLPVKL